MIGMLVMVNRRLKRMPKCSASSRSVIRFQRACAGGRRGTDRVVDQVQLQAGAGAPIAQCIELQPKGPNAVGRTRACRAASRRWPWCSTAAMRPPSRLVARNAAVSCWPSGTAWSGCSGRSLFLPSARDSRTSRRKCGFISGAPPVRSTVWTSGASASSVEEAVHGARLHDFGALGTGLHVAVVAGQVAELADIDLQDFQRRARQVMPWACRVRAEGGRWVERERHSSAAPPWMALPPVEAWKVRSPNQAWTWPPVLSVSASHGHAGDSRRRATEGRAKIGGQVAMLSCH